MTLKTKRLVAAAAVGVSALTAALVQAQGTGPGAAGPTPEQVKAARARLDKELSITSAQRTKLDAIESKFKPQFEKYQQQMVKLQQEVRALGMKAEKETMAVLTPQQREKLQKLQAAEIEKLKKMQTGGNSGR